MQHPSTPPPAEQDPVEAPPTGRADPELLRSLINDHAPAVYRTALAIVRDPAMAEDVAQETLIRVWESYSQFRGDGSIRGWILRIAHNQAVSALRRVRDEAWDPATLPDGELDDPTADPDRLAILLGNYAEIKVVLDGLDPMTRSILVLREVEGLSYEEISAAVDAPVPTVRARLYRLRQGFEKARSAQGVGASSSSNPKEVTAK
jgi:RNA polymerase sigma-70 factor (ECF subfamily)